MENIWGKKIQKFPKAQLEFAFFGGGGGGGVAMYMACRSSWVRDWTRTTAVTTQDPYHTVPPGNTLKFSLAPIFYIAFTLSVLGIISNLELILKYMGGFYMQMLYHFIKETCVSLDFGIRRGSCYEPPQEYWGMTTYLPHWARRTKAAPNESTQLVFQQWECQAPYKEKETISTRGQECIPLYRSSP